MKKSKKILNATTCCSVGLHFSTCCLPLIVTVFGGAFSLTSIIGHTTMNVIMIVSGLLLGYSWIAWMKKDCRGKWQAIFLGAVTILFIISTVLHFFPMAQTGAMSCH